MIVVCLPVADRRRAHAFYRDALGLEAIGAPASDGVPEPLQFALAEGVRLMLIPTGGFGWVVGDRDVAPPEQSECLLSRSAEDDAEVRVVIDKALAAGAEPVTAPGRQPWGYAGAFADPDGHVWMVTSAPIGG
ncbi:MAG: VOC family protein [Solirubrobacteraceae bacterium]